MGLVYFPTFAIKINHSCRYSKYASPMDGMGQEVTSEDKVPVFTAWHPPSVRICLNLWRNGAKKENIGMYDSWFGSQSCTNLGNIQMNMMIWHLTLLRNFDSSGLCGHGRYICWHIVYNMSIFCTEATKLVQYFTTFAWDFSPRHIACFQNHVVDTVRRPTILPFP